MLKFEITGETLDELVQNLFHLAGKLTQVEAPTALPAAMPQPVAPTSAAVSTPAPVPLAAAPTYTFEQLAHAGADLVTREPAKGPAAQSLLKQFGVEAVSELPKDRYGEFATALRGLGANI